MTTKKVKNQLAMREARRLNRIEADDLGQYEMRPIDPLVILGIKNDPPPVITFNGIPIEFDEKLKPGEFYLTTARIRR